MLGIDMQRVTIPEQHTSISIQNLDPEASESLKLSPCDAYSVDAALSQSPT
jgi:hypothetical protein